MKNDLNPALISLFAAPFQHIFVELPLLFVCSALNDIGISTTKAR
jgi:hypothetical protein